MLPYATWTVIYFAMGLAQAGRIGSIAAAAGRLGWLLLTGYDQLYFLVVLLQFYLIYPAFLWLIRRTERHHWWLLAASLAAEAVLFWLVHEQDLPGWMLGKGATRELWNYELSVIAGGVLAWHYQDVHAGCSGTGGPCWPRRRPRSRPARPGSCSRHTVCRDFAPATRPIRSSPSRSRCTSA